VTLLLRAADGRHEALLRRLPMAVEVYGAPSDERWRSHLDELLPWADQLGAARSLMTTLMVTSTAAGPILFGQALQWIGSIDTVLGLTLLLCVACALPSLVLLISRRPLAGAH
jgi:hypothetical protein